MAGWHGYARTPLAARSPARQRNGLTKQGPPAEVQIFGRRDSRATQKALRFFRERRIRTVFVDLTIKPIAPTELRRFAQRFTVGLLVDDQSRPYRDLGLAYLRLEDDQLFDRLITTQALLRLPLVRAGELLSAGPDEQAWRGWLNPRDDD